MSLEQDARLVLRNTHTAFQGLGAQVTRTLRTQLGDSACLNEQKRVPAIPGSFSTSP